MSGEKGIMTETVTAHMDNGTEISFGCTEEEFVRIIARAQEPENAGKMSVFTYYDREREMWRVLFLDIGKVCAFDTGFDMLKVRDALEEVRKERRKKSTSDLIRQCLAMEETGEDGQEEEK